MSTRPLASTFFTILAAAVALGGCSQSSAPPAQSANAAPAATAPAAPAAPDSAQQNATVSELLAPRPSASGNASTDAVAATPRAAAQSGTNAASETDNASEYATVVSVQKLAGPQQVCTDQTVVEKRPQQDQHKVAGTVIGAIAGGVIGNQFGGGRGRTVATVGGAVAGGAIGHKIQSDHQDKDTVTRVVKHCRPVTASEAGSPLYDVVYSYQGQTFRARLDYDPGDRIALPVRSVE